MVVPFDTGSLRGEFAGLAADFTSTTVVGLQAKIMADRALSVRMVWRKLDSMKPSIKIPVLLLYAAVGVLGLFATFLAVNFYVLGRAPALMEHIMGKTSMEIAAFHAPVLTFFVAGFRMFTLLLATYVLGAAILIRAFSRGDALAGRVVFTTQAIFTPLAAVTGMMASLQAPWPVFAVSGVLTLVAFIMVRGRTAVALE